MQKTLCCHFVDLSFGLLNILLMLGGFFPLCPQQGSLVLTSSSMASPEDVIEPAVQSSAAQTVSRRRFSHDLYNLSPDELDGLMSSSGERNGGH